MPVDPVIIVAVDDEVVLNDAYLERNHVRVGRVAAKTCDNRVCGAGRRVIGVGDGVVRVEDELGLRVDVLDRHGRRDAAGNVLVGHDNLVGDRRDHEGAGQLALEFKEIVFVLLRIVRRSPRGGNGAVADAHLVHSGVCRAGGGIVGGAEVEWEHVRPEETMAEVPRIAFPVRIRQQCAIDVFRNGRAIDCAGQVEPCTIACWRRGIPIFNRAANPGAVVQKDAEKRVVVFRRIVEVGEIPAAETALVPVCGNAVEFPCDFDARVLGVGVVAGIEVVDRHPCGEGDARPVGNRLRGVRVKEIRHACHIQVVDVRAAAHPGIRPKRHCGRVRRAVAVRRGVVGDSVAFAKVIDGDVVGPGVGRRHRRRERRVLHAPICLDCS